MGDSREEAYRAGIEAQMEEFADSVSGNLFSQVAVVTSGSAELAPEVADALGKAFAALGWAQEPLLVVGTAELVGERLQLCMEVLDPPVSVALDARAGATLAAAYGVRPPAPGVLVAPLGRRMVVLDDFAAALSDPAAKRVAWGQLKAAAPEG